MLQVKDYYYRLRSQFQKLDSDKDVDCLTHKEVFQAMSHMWIRVSDLATVLSSRQCRPVSLAIANPAASQGTGHPRVTAHVDFAAGYKASDQSMSFFIAVVQGAQAQA